jgi:Tol biopolymer transport system component
MRFLLPFDQEEVFEWSPTISPDGSMIAFYRIRTAGGRADICVRAMNSLDVRTVVVGLRPEFGGMLWSPDSRTLAYFNPSEKRLMSVDIAGNGNPVIITEVADAWEGTWGADDIILLGGNSTIRQVRATGGEITKAVVPDSANGESWVWSPCFLPDGRHFLFCVDGGSKRGENGKESILRMGSLDHSESQDLFPCDMHAEYDPAGYIVYAHRGMLYARKFDPEKPDLVGDPIQLKAPDFNEEFSISGTGVLVYSKIPIPREGTVGQSTLTWIDRQGRVVDTLSGFATNGGVRLSSDGRKAVYAVSDSAGVKWRIWVHDLERDIAVRLTTDEVTRIFPVWSPDNTKVLCRNGLKDDGRLQFWVFPVDGSGEGSLVYEFTSANQWLIPFSWCPDNSIICALLTNGTDNIDIIRLTLGPPGRIDTVVATAYRERSPAASPDGKLLAYVSDESGEDQVYLMKLDGSKSKWRVSPKKGRSPLWSKDGRELFYCESVGVVDTTARIMSLPIQNAESMTLGTPMPVCEYPIYGLGDWNLNNWRYDVSPDGTRFVVHDISGVFKELRTATLGTMVELNWRAEL